MSLSAKEAAELVGMSKPGLIKAIRQGKISAAKDIKGEWRIEPVELLRVYTPISRNGAKLAATEAPQLTPEHSEGLRVELAQLKQRLADKDDVIADLRQRLDAEAEERRKLTMILTEVRKTPTQPEPQRKPASWFTRWFTRDNQQGDTR